MTVNVYIRRAGLFRSAKRLGSGRVARAIGCVNAVLRHDASSGRCDSHAGKDARQVHDHHKSVTRCRSQCEVVSLHFAATVSVVSSGRFTEELPTMTFTFPGSTTNLLSLMSADSV